MAEPKRRHSHTRTKTRRAQYKVTQSTQLHDCPNCGTPKMYHRICPSCGQYRGRTIVARDSA